MLLRRQAKGFETHHLEGQQSEKDCISLPHAPKVFE
jgi:hypothetical protein